MGCARCIAAGTLARIRRARALSVENSQYNRPMAERWENPMGTDGIELIQRKGDEGFGEGNFKAPFESIELDQMRRGVL